MIHAQHRAADDAATLQPANPIGDSRLRGAELACHVIGPARKNLYEAVQC